MTLKRSIGKWDLVLMMVNATVGAGIFGLPSKIYKLVGVYSIAAFITCAFVVFIFILVFAEVSSRYYKTGGPYLYTFDAFGHFPGFMMGWISELTRVLAYAAVINLLISYLSFSSPLFDIPGYRISTIVFVTLLLAFINYIGIKISTQVGNILTIAKLLPLTAFIIIGLFHIKFDHFKSTQSLEFSSFSTSVLYLTFAFGGFGGVVVNSGEIKNPRKTLPFALFASMAIVTVIYCLIQIICVGNLSNLASSEKPIAEAASDFIGPTGGTIIAIGAIISMMGTLNLNIIIGSRLPFALSSEGQLPKFFSHLHPKYQTPTLSILFYSATVMIISITGSFIYAVSIGVITSVLIYLVISASLIMLRKKRPEEKKYFKLRFGRIFAISGIVFSFWLLVGSKPTELLDVAICLIIASIFYILFNKLKKRTRDHGEYSL